MLIYDPKEKSHSWQEKNYDHFWPKKKVIHDNKFCLNNNVSYNIFSSMSSDQKDRFIEYLIEQNESQKLDMRAMQAVLVDMKEELSKSNESLNELTKLRSEISSLRSELQQARKERKSLERKNARLQEKLEFANKKRFGSKSQKSNKPKSTTESESQTSADRGKEEDNFDGTSGSIEKEKGHSWQEKFMTIPSAERKTIHEHLWLIDGHFWPKEKVIHAKKNLWLIYVSLVENLWPFQARSAKPFMNIYGSLMLIYDSKKKVIHDKKNLCLIDWKFMTIPSAERKIIHEHLWLIDAHLWPKEKSHSWQEKFMTIFDPKKKSFMLRKIYVSFMSHFIGWKLMTIPSAERKTIHEHLWLIDAHLWPKEKSHSWQEKFMIIFD